MFDFNNKIVEQLSEIENMMYKPHENFEEELEALVCEPIEDEGFVDSME